MEKEIISSLLKTKYKVLQGNIMIRVGEQNHQLDELLRKYGHMHWAYLTPWNPNCETLTPDENMKRSDGFKNEVEPYEVLEGEAVGEDHSFKPEKSYLVLGIEKEKAIALGKKFEQYAIVTGIRDHPAELNILL